MKRRIGVDSSKIPRSRDTNAIRILKQMKELGFDGVFFRTAFELSATLDQTELSDVMHAAADLDMYVEAGTAKCNPYATAEAPEIRALGEGSHLAGMQRLILALSAAGIKELWTATANYKFQYRGLLACDRFRTDVQWADQLVATQKYLQKLTPVLRDVGAHLNIETHEEITSFETVRLVEALGPDTFGVTFDVANVVARGEDPVAAARRVAPYVRQTHLRDVALVANEDGFGRFIVPVGEGIVDWKEVLPALLSRNDDLNLSIEGASGDYDELSLFINDARWTESHTDLTAEEFVTLTERAATYADQVRSGHRPGLNELRRVIDETDEWDFLVHSAERLRRLTSAMH